MSIQVFKYRNINLLSLTLKTKDRKNSIPIIPELKCCDVGHNAMVSLSHVDQTKH
jgi:hypothetical protein